MPGDALGDRMKRYEHSYRIYMPLRMPVIVRVDGKAFHTWTRGLARPFDAGFMANMQGVAAALCEEMQGACLAFVQSDEISVLLHNYRRLETDAWFHNNLQKVVSISAAVASATMTRLAGRDAWFDSRAFILPENEVCNYFLWRQQDAARNSIQMVAQSLYSHTQLLGKNTKVLQEMIHQKGQNWNDYPTAARRGAAVVRCTYEKDGVIRHGWATDYEIPIFSQDRSYIERHLAVESEAA